MRPGKISVASKGGAEGKTLNITVMRNQKPRIDEDHVVKQILKVNQANSSVEEKRDGSIIFV